MLAALCWPVWLCRDIVWIYLNSVYSFIALKLAILHFMRCIVFLFSNASHLLTIVVCVHFSNWLWATKDSARQVRLSRGDDLPNDHVLQLWGRLRPHGLPGSRVYSERHLALHTLPGTRYVVTDDCLLLNPILVPLHSTNLIENIWTNAE